VSNDRVSEIENDQNDLDQMTAICKPARGRFNLPGDGSVASNDGYFLIQSGNYQFFIHCSVRVKNNGIENFVRKKA
jgi:hypothetical protein